MRSPPGGRSAPTSPCAAPSSSAIRARPRPNSKSLLDWLDEAQLDRVGCFKYEDVAGARSNALPDHVAEEVKQETGGTGSWPKRRTSRAAKLAAKVGKQLEVIVDEVDGRRRHLPDKSGRAGD